MTNTKWTFARRMLPARNKYVALSHLVPGRKIPDIYLAHMPDDDTLKAFRKLIRESSDQKFWFIANDQSVVVLKVDAAQSWTYQYTQEVSNENRL